MKIVHTLCCTLLVATLAFAQQSSEAPRTLVGTWRVVEFADVDKNGDWQYWFGKHPRGYFVYDATGQVHIQIMRTPALPSFAEMNSDEGR